MKTNSFFTIPLSTERLLLRPFAKTDAEALFHLNSDPEVLRLTIWKPLQSIQEAEDWIESVFSEQYAKHGYGRLAVTLRDTGELIGWSGVKFASDFNMPTLGYRFMKQHWGKGYGTEAAMVSVLHAFHTIGLKNIYAWVFEENSNSKNILVKTGFKSTSVNQEIKSDKSQYEIHKNPDYSFDKKPLFETDRLAFYEITEEDAGVMYALNCDQEVIKYIGDHPFESLTAARSFIVERYEENTKLGYGRWKVLVRATGECIGWCGLKFLTDKNVTAVGYRFFRRHWGNGYATEAAKASIDYGFFKLKLERITAHARKDNVASVKVLQKCGMKITGEDVDCGGEIFVFDIIRNSQI